MIFCRLLERLHVCVYLSEVYIGLQLQYPHAINGGDFYTTFLYNMELTKQAIIPKEGVDWSALGVKKTSQSNQKEIYNNLGSIFLFVLCKW